MGSSSPVESLAEPLVSDGETDFNSQVKSLTLEQFLEQKQFGEIAFYENVRLLYLEEIWVSRVRRDELLSQLRENGVLVLNGKPIEAVVQSPDDFEVQYTRNINPMWDPKKWPWQVTIPPKSPAID